MCRSKTSLMGVQKMFNCFLKNLVGDGLVTPHSSVTNTKAQLNYLCLELKLYPTKQHLK